MPDDERHVHPGADQAVGLATVHDREGVRAVELAQRGPDRVGEVAVVGLLDEVRDRLRVGLGGQGVAPRLEPVAQLAEVLDDPVVDDRDLARAVQVGVGVEIVRPAVGRPAGVGEADRRVGRAVGDRGLEVGQLAGPLLDEQVAGVVDEGDPGRVVAAVLEATQTLDEDRARLTRSGIADDPAHAVRCLLRGPRRARLRAGSSLDAPLRGPRSRRPARATRAASGPSTITRRAGSVPDGRTRIRPLPPSRVRRPAIARWRTGSPSHWSL